ncbi:MAG: ribonuclease HII [Candidatus Methanoliparum thermophilum]|uniref:Ribonuclease HII n=1 Tax=Methanoliparum thermophilum TaxID=2491083 RepID=A0A520KRJ9_METT2|nr:ribonuclease HII [Candidatus Methanoliparum sp. LAM-1]RZN64311.1 MAG: ribonuclease HII [Candidatus Methanoliparum thermophilum]BDC35570.1 ribonuclease HII [Candidatus Methanoliparum sp. LAM-1]
MNYLGVDEAGKGPVMGSMFIGGVLINKINYLKIEELLIGKNSFNDSKKIKNKKREEFYNIFKDFAKIEVYEISASEIDKLRTKYTMNEIMVIAHAGLIRKFEREADVIYLDASDVNEDRFGMYVKKLIEKFVKPDLKIISKHKADETYPLVAAASIVAKVWRERHIADLKRVYGDFGSGYPSDPKTIKFLTDFYKKYNTFPEIVRTSWKTCERIKNAVNQRDKSIFNYFSSI